MKVIILMGAPGSGKGTTAERIRVKAGLVHVSTGDMLRAAVKNGTDLGIEAETYMTNGALVPDDLIVRMVEERLDQGKSDDAYLFDGFPRTIPQADLLDQSLARRGGRIECVLFLESSKEVILSRLTGRRTCRKCNSVYHITNIPPKKAGVCDECGGELYQRDDDKTVAILKRFDVYERETAGLISRYEQKGLLVRVGADLSADRVAEGALAIIQKG